MQEVLMGQEGTAIIFPLSSKEEQEEKLSLLAQIIRFAVYAGADRSLVTPYAYDLWTVRVGDRLVPTF